MALVANAIEQEDNADSVLAFLNNILTATSIYNLLMGIYLDGYRWAIITRAKANQKAKVSEKLNTELLRRIVRERYNNVAVKRAFDILNTQKKQIRTIIEHGKEDNKSSKEIAIDIRNNPHVIKQTETVFLTETVSTASFNALTAAEQSIYQYTKTWWSRDDEIVRYPGNPWYENHGYPNPKFNHIAVHGQTLPLNESFVNTLGAIRFPGDPNAHIGNIIRCRCFLEVNILVDSNGRPIRKSDITILTPNQINRPTTVTI